MQGGTKTAVIIALILLIVIAVGMYLKKTGMVGGPQIPDWVMEQKHEKINEKTLELKTLTYREWRKLGIKEGKYKDPESGDYVMVPPMKCVACEATIPRPMMPAPPAMKPGAPGAEPRPEEDMMAMEMKWRKECKCPKCGKNPFPPEEIGR